ncbi:hypothetical protein NAE50_005328, partial [Salmonella enterica]|nr:hypothetical protein [Salmonella enterica]
GTINLSGAAINSGKGVNVTNAVLNASKACITGNNGFSITSTTLEGALADLTSVSLSSAGSAAGVTNTLDSSIVTADNRDNLLAKKIENMTTMDMGGQAIFDDSTKTDKGWKQDYTSSDTPNGGWIFNNTTVNAGGNVDVKGASFTNSTLTVTDGNLSLDNGGPAPLTGTSITANDGFVSVHAKAGNIDLIRGNISAKNDITLTNDRGAINLSGLNSLLNSIEGKISMESGMSVAITGGAKVKAAQDLSIVVNNKNSTNNIRGFNSTDSVLSGNNIDISVAANVSGYYSILFLQNSSFSGKDIFINASGSGHAAEIYYVNTFLGNLTFTTNTTASFTNDNPADIFLGDGSRINVKGNAKISSVTNGQGIHGSALYLAGGINVTGNLLMSGESGDGGTGVQTSGNNKEVKAGGTISILGKSKDGVAVMVTKGKVNGENVLINGTSGTGTGVYLFDGVALNNAEINGDSDSGVGTYINNNTNLNNVSVKGKSESGVGVSISGSLTNTKGTSLSGTSESKGVGMVLGSAASVSGGVLIATSVDGTGLLVNQGGRAENVAISAQTVTGQAIGGDKGALSTGGATSISIVGNAGSAADIAENVKPLPGTPTADINEVLGRNKLTAAISTLQGSLDTKLADLEGLQQSVSALQTQLTEAERDGTVGQPELTKLNAAVKSLSDTLNTATDLKGSFSALKSDTTGTLKERQNKADILSSCLQGLTLPSWEEINAVAGELVAAKALTSATVTLQGGGDKPAVDHPSVPSEPVHEHEHSQSHDASLIRQAEVSSQRRGAVNAQVTQRSQPTGGGFHAAGTPSVPVDGYTPAAQPVDISLCDGNDCQSESLDAGKPAKGSVTPSGK